MIEGSFRVCSYGDGATKGPEKPGDPHGDEGDAENDRAYRDRTTLNECERVPAVVSDVVVGAVEHDESDNRNDGDDERMQVHGLVEVSLEERDPGSSESTAGAGVARDEGEGAERNAQNESDRERDDDDADVRGSSPRSRVCPRWG